MEAMYLKKSKQKSGRIQLSIAEGYYDKSTKRTKTVNVKTLGYLDVLEKDYEDPIAFFTAEVARMNEAKAQENMPVTFRIDIRDTLTAGAGSRRNFGYAAFSKIYHELAIDEFVSNRQRYTKAEFSHNSILKLLVYSRLLCPASKKSTFENRDAFFDKFDFSLLDIYRSLGFFKKYKNALMLWIHEHIRAEYGRDTSLVYYDVTNYYFEIDKADEMRRKGVSKEHRPDPIVQMGLFMDTEGIPIYYGLFSGNTPDKQTLIPMMGKLLDHYSLGRIIVVADRGIITGDNIAQTLLDGNGYVFSYSVRGAAKDFKEYVLDQTGYRTNGSRDGFMIKSRVTPRMIHVTNVLTGKKEETEVDEKQVVFYSPKYAQKAKRDRSEAVAKARQYVKEPSKYNHALNYGASKYICNLKVDRDTGEILEEAKPYLCFDEERLKEEEKYDGYYAIVTSELEEPDEKVIGIYRGLWKIEESFKVTKSDIEARPVYLSRKDRIDAHFLTCFIALVLERILEKKLDHRHSTSAILESLRKCSCSHVEENYYLFDHYDDVLKDIGTVTGIDFSRKYMRLGEIRKAIGETKK